MQQPGAELPFQLGHLLGGRKLADAGLECRLAEGAEIDHAHKKPQCLDAFHVGPH